MKIPAPKGVITIFGDQQEARNIEKGHTPGQTNVYQLNSSEEKKEPYIKAKQDKEKIEIAADGETKKVYLDEMPDRAVTIGSSPEEENELVKFLNKNKDVFAWSAKDLQGVDRDIIEHTLETDEKIASKKQKLRKMSEEKVKAVEAEVQRLQDAKVIREVLYPVWLANTVLVKKKNGKWRMCVDFTNLNKACKNDFERFTTISSLRSASTSPRSSSPPDFSSDLISPSSRFLELGTGTETKLPS
jgi:hypothetical protein